MTAASGQPDLEQLLTFDPLHFAEQVTGQSYKEDKDTMAIGLALHLSHGDAKRAALEAADDTHYSTRFADTLRIYQSEGFEIVLDDTFPGHQGDDRLVILWNAGMLAVIESYGSATNQNTVYLNWRVPEVSHMGMSGHYAAKDITPDLIWVGDKDLRDGTRHYLHRLRAEGQILPQWVEQPFLWLLTYRDDDVEGYDYKAINAERLSRLPEHVRKAVLA